MRLHRALLAFWPLTVIALGQLPPDSASPTPAPTEVTVTATPSARGCWRVVEQSGLSRDDAEGTVQFYKSQGFQDVDFLPREGAFAVYRGHYATEEEAKAALPHDQGDCKAFGPVGVEYVASPAGPQNSCGTVVGKFMIQLGEFATREEASRFRDKIEQQYGHFPIDIEFSGKRHLVLLVPRQHKRPEVDKYAAELKAEGLAPKVLDRSFFVPDGSLQPVQREQNAHGNFDLWISNQSFEHPTVDITVRLDGQVVASDIFQVCDQHDWVLHRFDLTPGKHTIAVQSTKGNCRLEQTFDTSEVKFGITLSYSFYEEARFNLAKHDRQFGFL